MSLFGGSANVLSARQHTVGPSSRGASNSPLDEAEDALSNLRSIHGLFAASDNYDTVEHRAHKRRKVDDYSSTSIQMVNLEQDQSIVLANISLELNFLADSQDVMDADFSHSLLNLNSSLLVSLKSFQRIQQDAFQIVLQNSNNCNTTAITATASEGFLDSITPHVRTATNLTTSQQGKRSRALARAAFARCLLAPCTPKCNSYKLVMELRWALGLSVVEAPNVGLKYMKEDLKLLSRYLPEATAPNGTAWSLSDFYDSVHVPPVELQVSPRIQQALSDTNLYPFQTRAVDWLLRREGVAFSPSGTLEPFSDHTLPVSFVQTQDATGRACHISQLRGMVVSDLATVKEDSLQSLRGGILAEEMGLGKTVELIALVTHHKRDVSEGKIFDAYTGTHVTPSGATLIITPPSILEQWVSEVQNHAPELKVFHYKGLPAPSAPKKEHLAATVENLLRYDIVVTTYNVLSKEIHHATPPPDRSFRNAKRHKHRRSPLVEISWWRVCLDEAQMVESGVSQAATVARIVPRCNSWAVSGTPLRKDVQDLRGLLIFLRCTFANNRAVWDRLDKYSLRAILGQIALRHTKDKIREELRLPPQKRIVLTVPFTTIEEQNYNDLLRQMCDNCWLTPEGRPQDEGRDASHPDVIERMREWLVRLRQTCLHAHVGRKNRKALGAKQGALRTVHEVLEIMIEQNDASWKSLAREMILHQVKLGHIKAYAGNVHDRAQSALPYYEEALREAQTYVQACREELAMELHKLGRSSSTNSILILAGEPDSDVENEKDSENLGRIPVIRKALRSFLELEHACGFFLATTYHQIKDNNKITKPDSIRFHDLEKNETDWYQKAKMIRRELLKDSKNRAQRHMSKVDSGKPFHQIPRISDLPDFGGIESRNILETMDNISDFMNAQANQMQVWRMKIVDILLLRLVDDDDDQETTGEEYDESLKAQDELYVYIMALRTLVADRNAATHGLHDTLIEHELRAAEKLALRQEPDANRGHAPELVIEVADIRRKLQAVFEGGSLKGVISGIRSLITALQWRAGGGDTRAIAELTVVQKHFARIQTINTQQAKAITNLEKELEIFRTTMNHRLEYYRQFQHISDTVAKYKEELDDTFDEREFAKFTLLCQRKKESVTSLKTKYTYLKNLRAENEEDSQAECIICQEVIDVGVLTTCGHKYCKVCINTWWHQHRTCPMCKRKLRSADFKDINLKPSEIKAREEAVESTSLSQASSPATLNRSIYSDISESIMKEIKMIDLDGSYGTKIDMIARHLLWIRANDPGAKSIIFSQFGDFLEVLREALKKWHIGVSGIVEKDGIQTFKTDPAIDCFLLDAKSDSSGLNLVNATYVFLCEPLINPAIELQAIARVHRIGQQRSTTVFQYLIGETVEEAIYEISLARRLAHISESTVSSSRSGTTTPSIQENTLDKANSAELQAAPLKALLRKKGNGEEVKEDDLWHCLFGRQRKVVKPVLELELGRHLRAEAAEGRVAATEDT
ncbi:SNF2 family N-terminal domain-containing protein [Phaeosphaeriaceae sp. PMI808]|nr:SNF2 family N-terminal domain-containing protein [Phaeosphaeriaceae sp. PMI808]